MNPITAYSPAKINISLKILNKRADGYHNLQTIFLAINLCDEIRFEPSGTIALTCKGDDKIPLGAENLIIRAAELLKKEGNITKGINIQLKKKIPMGAGLGGGSSNAATTLKVLNEAWELHYPADKLIKLGLALGSDVPFFLSGYAAAIGGGRGEQLTKLPDFPEKWMVVVYPDVSVSTSWAFQRVTNLLTQCRQNVNLESLYKAFQKGQTKLSELLYNDFEEVVFSQYPVIYKAKQALLNNHAEGAVMTGSGSAVVGFFKEEKSAEHWIDKHNHWKAFLVQPLRSPANASAENFMEEEEQ